MDKPKFKNAQDELIWVLNNFDNHLEEGVITLKDYRLEKQYGSHPKESSQSIVKYTLYELNSWVLTTSDPSIIINHLETEISLGYLDDDHGPEGNNQEDIEMPEELSIPPTSI